MMKKQKTNGIKLLIRMVVKDSKGRVIQDTGQDPAKSFVIQFLKWLGGVFESTNINATDITGAPKNIVSTIRKSFEMARVDALVNDATHGIVVGTGDAAVDNTDIALETKIAHGSGAGQLTHGAQGIEAVAVVGANVDLELKRAFTNNSGGAIIVKEVGLYMKSKQNGTYAYFMVIRDVLAPAITVPDMCSLTIYYTLRTTV